MELRSGDEVWYKHVDELTREDLPARIESDCAKAGVLSSSGLRHMGLWPA